ncbi:hypothetical protein [Streptomyces sp. DSM 41634]|uniref:hypothetical protein n=1 Tax=Streptomyces sp. DSM 41634 TaxID=3448656 RepID=UPI002887C658|nr:hypothetical protein [Streptomyces sp. DSM 41633]
MISLASSEEAGADWACCHWESCLGTGRRVSLVIKDRGTRADGLEVEFTDIDYFDVSF